MLVSNLPSDVSLCGSHRQLFSYGRHIEFLDDKIVQPASRAFLTSRWLTMFWQITSSWRQKRSY